MNRRQALISIGLTALSRLSWSLPSPLLSPLHEELHRGPDALELPLQNTIDDHLREDLARLAPRVYSEEGIPVFLACVNLVPAKLSQQSRKVTLSPLSAALASTFHRNAEAFQRIRPDAEAKNIALIIEVLADRDFSTGDTGEEE